MAISKVKTAIIIPTIDEELNISNLIKKIYDTLVDENFIILVVDDNSKDNTVQIVKNLQEVHPNLYLLQRKSKRSIAKSYIEGFKYCIDLGCKKFVQMDADYSHHPRYLSVIIEKLNENNLVIASRNVPDGFVIGWNLIRKIISKGGSLYSRLVLGCPIKDLTSSYNGWTLDILNRIDLNSITSKGFCFHIEMKYKAYIKRARIFEFPIIYMDRKHGKSKLNKRMIFEAFFNVIKIKMKNPIV